MPNYGQFFPNGYQYGGYPAMNQQVQTMQQPQIQNGGFLSAPNEDYVLNYPIGLGNCLTFKIEGKPIVIEKSMGFSQLESPKIERYKLMKEDVIKTTETVQNDGDDIKSIIESIDKANDEIEAIWGEISRSYRRL